MSIADSMSALAGPKKPSPMQQHSAPPQEGEGGGDVHEHLQAMHAKTGGKHMHVHSDGNGHTSHQIGEDGKAEGPHDHESIEALKEHMARFFDAESHESGGSHESGHAEGLI